METMQEIAANLEGMSHKLIIVGADFGGLSAAKALAKQKSIEVTLIDNHNQHLFQPLLYQV